MPQQSPVPPPRPILARAADNGLYLGLYICVLVLAMGFSTGSVLASAIVWAGTLAMPFYVYRMLRRSYVAADGALSFPELWAEGIASFFLGTLLPALLTYVCLRFFAPTFIVDTVKSSIELLEAQGSPEAELWADTLRNVTTHSGLPTAVDVSAQLISFNIIAGTALSFLAAIAATVRGKVSSAQKR
ncbi:MAG: DUF4199 domain-containing protein [Muribaculaceae bacterium]|nr:DUF4199 domain-containing protein [Muribaculaceae bacterium]